MNKNPTSHLLLLNRRDRDYGEALAHSGYTIHRADTAEQAGELLDRLEAGGDVVEAVVACADSVAGDAITLLEHVYRRNRQPLRLLVADAGDSETWASPLNRGVIEKLLLRPCSARELVDIVDTAVQCRADLRELDVYRRRTEQFETAPRESDAGAKPGGAGMARSQSPATYSDALTGLVSRELLEDRLVHAIKSGSRHSKPVVLMLLGLDRFRYVNETFGQEIGDRVLAEAAHRVSGCIRSSDTLARFSGDVFGLLAGGAERAEDPGLMAQRILDVVATPIKVAEQHIVLTASIGIGLFPEDGRQPRDLIANTETAMRHAKQPRGNQFRFYCAEFNRIAGRRLSLESELRGAFKNHEFTLHYQPRVDATRNRIVGAEALLRWHHPKRGVIAPAEFLPVLEETGLIEPVGQWVLEQAAGALVRWRQQGLPPLVLAVNLSARQFRQKQLPELIAEIARSTALDLAGGSLEIEITESLLMEDVLATRRTLNRLNEMGLRIAIDDFGTGYSALSYLIKFPLDYLKIDKSFVDRLGESDDAKAIVEAIISLSYSLHLTVIAEGVETREQFLALQALGCKQFQGYLFARPMPEEEFIEAVSEDGGTSIATLEPQDRLLHQPIPDSAHGKSSIRTDKLTQRRRGAEKLKGL